MNDTKHWDALRAAGDVQPPTPETLTRATTKLEAAARGGAVPTPPGARRPVTRRWRALVVAASAAAVAGVGVGFAVLQSGTPTAVPAPPATTPSASSTTYPPSKPLGGGPGVSAQCVYALTPERFAKVPVAFDGTVLSAVKVPRTPFGWNVTFQVNEWFRPSSGKQQFTVQMFVGPGHRVQVSEAQGYEIGDRLLISATPRTEGGDPMDRPFAGICDFSRTYDVPTADTWRKVFSK